MPRRPVGSSGGRATTPSARSGLTQHSGTMDLTGPQPRPEAGRRARSAFALPLAAGRLGVVANTYHATRTSLGISTVVLRPVRLVYWP
jgi:hypothetical protein